MTLTDYMFQEEREEEDLPALKTASTHGYNDYIKKAQRKTDHSHPKQYKRHVDQRNDNNQKTKAGSKTTLWTFQTINKRHLTREIGLAKKRKP